MTKSPFGIRGVIEGFYGTCFTVPERDDLIRFAGENGFNFYVKTPALPVGSDVASSSAPEAAT